MNEYLIELIVDAILSDICKNTDEWADPTGDKAIEIVEIERNKHII